MMMMRVGAGRRRCRRYIRGNSTMGRDRVAGRPIDGEEEGTSRRRRCRRCHIRGNSTMGRGREAARRPIDGGEEGTSRRHVHASRCSIATGRDAAATSCSSRRMLLILAMGMRIL